jgi:hypothetical protein
MTCGQLKPEQDSEVLKFDLGLTDRVKRWTKSPQELMAADFQRGRQELCNRLAENGWPCILAFNGKKGLA